MDLGRYQTLKSQNSIAAQQAEDQAYTAKTAQANLNLAKQQLEALKAQKLSVEATLAQAQTQLHQAQVNLERTRIVSPARIAKGRELYARHHGLLLHAPFTLRHALRS